MYQKEILELTKALNPNYYFVTLFFKYKYIIVGGVDWKRAGGGGGWRGVEPLLVPENTELPVQNPSVTRVTIIFLQGK